MKRTEQKPRPHGVYVVEGEGESAFWTKVGAAWNHQDGKGFNITLSCLPLNGRLVVRQPQVDEDEETGQ